MCWKWHQMSALAERSGRGEVKPSLFRAVMKTDARALTQGARGKPQLLEPPGADPHAGWCGRGERVTAPPIPIFATPYLIPPHWKQFDVSSSSELKGVSGRVLSSAAQKWLTSHSSMRGVRNFRSGRLMSRWAGPVVGRKAKLLTLVELVEFSRKKVLKSPRFGSTEVDT